MSKNRYSGVDSYAVFFIAYKAKLLTKSPFFVPDDFEDIQQELMLAYLHAWPDFNKKSGDPRSFTKAIVNNHVRYLIDLAQSQKRWTGQKDISIHSISSNGDEKYELIDTLASDAPIWGNTFASSDHASLELIFDLENILNKMPKNLCRTFYLLNNFTITDAAKIEKVPRTTMSSRAKSLRKYLNKELFKK